MMMLVNRRRVTECLRVRGKESVYFVLPEIGTAELHLQYANLVELVKPVVIVFRKTYFEILTYYVQIDRLQLTRLIVAAGVVV